MSKGKKRTKRTKTAIAKQQLDDETSALVLAEYLVMGDVTVDEIKFIEEVGGPLSYRQIALTYKVSDVLGIPACFEMAPRFHDVFEDARSEIHANEYVRATPWLTSDRDRHHGVVYTCLSVGSEVADRCAWVLIAMRIRVVAD